MMLKIMFMNGPSQDPSDRFFGWPTSLLYAIAPTIESIKRGDFQFDYVRKIFDPVWYVEGKNSDNVKKEFKRQANGVDIIIASVTYDSLYPTLQLFAEAKKSNPHVQTILGGPHIDETHNMPDINIHFQNPKLVDYLIAGDAELLLRDLLEAIADGKNHELDFSHTHGKAWLYHNQKVFETDGSPIDLNSLPFMPIELIDDYRHRNDFDVFSDENGNVLPTIQMIAQRGCPYTCNFCSERRQLAKPQSRSIESILQEIKLRKKQGFKAIFFDDSTFGSYPKLNDLLERLEETGMVFGSLNRFDHLTNSRIVEKYKDAGFTYLYCSIEQFHNQTLKRMEKHQEMQKISDSIEKFSVAGIKLGVSLLWGFPYETATSIQKTLDFTRNWVEKGTIILISESVLSFHPGTPLGMNKRTDFNSIPPHQGYPWNRFEEGQWYHPPHVTAEYLERILKTSEKMFGEYMVRNRHSWYAKHGYLLDNFDPVALG